MKFSNYFETNNIVDEEAGYFVLCVGINVEHKLAINKRVAQMSIRVFAMRKLKVVNAKHRVVSVQHVDFATSVNEHQIP